MKHFLFWILCTIVCKALFPYPSGDFGRPEVVNNRQTSHAGQSDIYNYSPISYIEAEKHIAFPDIPIWENQETDDEDDTGEGFWEEALHVGFGATISANASALDLRVRQSHCLFYSIPGNTFYPDSLSRFQLR
jgi:hypothetical protein